MRDGTVTTEPRGGHAEARKSAGRARFWQSFSNAGLLGTAKRDEEWGNRAKAVIKTRSCRMGHV